MAKCVQAIKHRQAAFQFAAYVNALDGGNHKVLPSFFLNPSIRETSTGALTVGAIRMTECAIDGGSFHVLNQRTLRALPKHKISQRTAFWGGTPRHEQLVQP